MHFYSDGLKLDVRVEGSSTRSSGAFPAKVDAIRDAVDKLINLATSARVVSIYYDSEVAINSLGSLIVGLELMEKCATSLSVA